MRLCYFFSRFLKFHSQSHFIQLTNEPLSNYDFYKSINIMKLFKVHSTHNLYSAVPTDKMSPLFCVQIRHIVGVVTEWNMSYHKFYELLIILLNEKASSHSCVWCIHIHKFFLSRIFCSLKHYCYRISLCQKFCCK